MYEKISSYKGDLTELISLTTQLEFREKSTGYRATDASQEALIEELFQPLLHNIFPGFWGKVMIVTLLPQGHLPAHSDQKLVGTWCHLVLQTNSGCWNMHDGSWQQLERGSIYCIDPSLPHGSINWGSEPRTHFIVEVLS